MKKILGCITSTFAIGLAMSSNTLAVTIDNFNSGRIVHSSLAPLSVEGSVAVTSGDAISPIRQYQYKSFASEKETLLPSGFSTNGAPSVLSISNAPSTTSILSLAYEGNFNLSPLGENFFSFDVLNNDLPVIVSTIINNESVTIPIPPKTKKVLIPFTDFPETDFQDVNFIGLHISGNNDFDLALDNLGTEQIVSEPSLILATVFLSLGLTVVKFKSKDFVSKN